MHIKPPGLERWFGQYRMSGDDDQGESAFESLDIKPPQAARANAVKKRSFKEKKHSREHKHKDRDRDRDHNRERERLVREREKERFDDRRHRQPTGAGREWERHSKRRERHDYHDQSEQRVHDYHARQQHKIRDRDKRQVLDPRDRERDRDRDRRKGPAEHYYESKVDAERALEDLRTRLLSKRHKYVKELSRYPDSRSGTIESKRDGRDRRENIELIDSPEHYSDYTSSSNRTEKKDKKERPEDPEQAARRARLLEAERQIARQKELAKQELEARRELHRERNRNTTKRHHDSEGILKKHKRPRKPSPKEEGEYEEKDVKIIDNDSDEEESTEDEDVGKDSGSDSDSLSGSVHSQKVRQQSAEDDDVLPGSPLSVGELAKSEHGRRSGSRSPRSSHSMRSRSHSRSDRSGSVHSRSPRSHSKSRSRSKSRSHSTDRSVRSISKSRSRSRSHSPSRSRSRSASRSRSHSHSRSRSHSRSGSRSPTSRSRSRSQSVEIKDRKNTEEDIEMKEIKPSDSKIPEPAKEDDSPRDEKGEKLPNYFPGIQGCRSVEEFQCLNRIEEGTYGVVYRAKDRRTNEIVALKRLKMEKEKEGFPITSLREINTLLKGQHPNIVTVREIVVGSNMDKIFIVMDYVEHDLKSLMETMKHKEQTFFPAEVKCLMQQLLRAVGHLHDNWILHRDLKASNLLLSHKGILKVGDFGLAREYGSPLKAYTSLVVTLWYRAPELLLCTKEYSTPIDMWSVGCIFAEFLQMAPLFPGKTEMDQLNKIFKELGTPNDKIWPGYKDLPAVQNLISQNPHFTEYPVSNLRRRFSNKASELGMSLLQGLLTYDPKQRFTAEQALKSPYFKELPLPIDPSMFPTWPAKSELGARKALASSPKPPSGGSQFKQLGRDDIPAVQTAASSKTGFVLNANMDQRQLAMAPGFSLKF
ncbi:serine/threonine-protein kinase PITSLRE isoform X2 [Hermetia illucens]|uniref:serine/threonine-protein kinase PITSLRE isoform X2 n=1 Tax=Hermetia illucens TaxID=343691 RepID=UPI0018CC0646|nr:serine/threonine-protein kinase PITSLRE isoform X2 [Hermetia illucens]